MSGPPPNSPAFTSEAESIRHRASWLYYYYGLTQREIAERLGVSRSTVIRMLELARKQSEVQIWLNEFPGDCTALAIRLENEFDLERAVVVPSIEGADSALTARSVGAALGIYMSNAISDGMIVGVGWGRTLSALLDTFRPNRCEGAKVLSLLGGLSAAHGVNPTDVSWQMANRLGAECLLLPAPLIVNSAETKRVLIEECGLNRLMELGEAMDVAVISCGETKIDGSSLSEAMIPRKDYRSLVDKGAVGDVMCHFLNDRGESVDHPIHGRVMSVSPDAVKKAARVVLASGGAGRASAIRATLMRFGCRVLITDEGAASALLAL